MSQLNLPSGSQIRVTQAAGATLLLIAPPGREATTTSLVRPRSVTCFLTFEAGVCWPDRIGRTMASDALAHGEMATFQFERLADALRCEARLHREAAR